MARSSSDIFTIGRIACRREGVFVPIENAFYGITDKRSAVAEMGDRFATTDMVAVYTKLRRKKHAPCTTETGLDMRRNVGGCCAPFRGGSCMGPHLTQCGLRRGLPPYQVAS